MLVRQKDTCMPRFFAYNGATVPSFGFVSLVGMLCSIIMILIMSGFKK